ncbi:hypothetical protein HYH03_014394 [Edaphochlamys debaryana]|uniref:Fumarylacetoacetase n=1 Tax=Edaphochlamys debaryana TaxID=47281 RepID=A0A835XWD9_9CHLO|nr:hypothetical protein HYH03_014394 [Edaphochlamys debaryana]|eukprot:KAG2487024.1 hypothetical protein HYH03_014394 [Edaphochlamys debaryana]
MESFIDVAPDSDFPLENLPWGVFEAPGADGTPETHIGVALGEHAVSATAVEAAGLLKDLPGVKKGVFATGQLNEFAAAGRPAWRSARAQLQRLLGAAEGALRDDPALRPRAIFKQSEVRMRLPCAIGDYTDFYTSRQHASNVTHMFRGQGTPLNPNWLHLPVAYHGRSSSIVPSGVDVRRPWGQRLPPKPPAAEEGQGSAPPPAGSAAAPAAGAAPPTPIFAPSAAVDFELEMGAIIGPGNSHGEPIPVASAWDHVFGLVLLNDWSARDIQLWEYVPLGPFNAKNWASQISPWVVTLDALEPFKTKPPPQTEAEVLPYLRDPDSYTYDVRLTAAVTPAGADQGTVITRSNLRHLYWTHAQMIAHHTVGGCNLRPGDLIGSGTISGDTPDSRGCLLELTWAGRDPVGLAGPGGAAVQRTYLEDGDGVAFRAGCGGEGEGAGAGARRIGFGTCSGRLLPAREA